jgi:hypothetical protein
MESLGLLEQIGSAFIANGAVGLFAAYLLYLNAQLRAELREKEHAHRVELAAERALTLQTQEKRLEDNRKGFDIASSNERALAANSSLIEAALDAFRDDRRATRRRPRT